MEKTDKTQEITDWFHTQNNDKVAHRQTAIQYATDLMEGKITAKSTNYSEPIGQIWWVLMEQADADFTYRYLQFYIEQEKKKQSKIYWDKYVVLPYHLQFLKKYPNHLDALQVVLEIMNKKDFQLPDNYWQMCYESPLFYIYKPKIPQYIHILTLLVQALQTQKGDQALKNAEIERITNFRNMMKNVWENAKTQNNILFDTDYDLTFTLSEFYLVYLQISTNAPYHEKQVLEDAENILLVTQLMTGESGDEGYNCRKFIAFEKLSAKKITLGEFLGIDITKLSKNFTEDIFPILGDLPQNKIAQGGVLEHLFHRPYRPDLKRLPYLPKNIQEENEVKSFFLSFFTKDYLLLDLNNAQNDEIEIWSISTNTSHFFDAGNEWFGARFWAIHHKKLQKTTFLLSSFTD